MTLVTRILTHYRVPFHERVRELCADHGVRYQLVYGQPDADEASKGDLATVDWGRQIRNRPVFGRGKLVWQSVSDTLGSSDLLILGQENQLLVNYPLQIMRATLRPRIALWGHGRNFQSRRPAGPAERWKRIWATRCDWWFAYTEESRRHVETLGFPPDRITVFNNAVDTGELGALASAVSADRLSERRAELGLVGKHVGIFVGGLYEDKRLDFLVAAAERIRARIPDFELLVVGGGIEAGRLAGLIADKPWIHALGPRFGADKAELMRLAHLFLMPGLLGLAVLDAAAAGLPTVTTAFPYHSPEIAYLEDGVNGLIVEQWRDPDAYAAAVADLLSCRDRLERLTGGATAVARRYTIEEMARRFTEGALTALETKKR